MSYRARITHASNAMYMHGSPAATCLTIACMAHREHAQHPEAEEELRGWRLACRRDMWEKCCFMSVPMMRSMTVALATWRTSILKFCSKAHACAGQPLLCSVALLTSDVAVNESH